MSFLLRRRSPFPRVTCFFCLTPAVLVPPLPPSDRSRSPSSSATYDPDFGRSRGSSDVKGKGKEAEIDEAQTAVGTPRSWYCGACGCWNRTDENGQILSDEPAMHDPALNEETFAKRGAPSSHSFTASWTAARRSSLSSSSPFREQTGPAPGFKSMFCHSCLTNQRLVTDLLSQYLPDEDDPSYPDLLAALPVYQESLAERYPLLCSKCLPRVEEELDTRNRRVRGNVLAGWLAESERQRSSRALAVGGGEAGERDSEGQPWKAHSTGMEYVWRLRGLLWVMTTFAGLSASAYAALSPSLESTTFSLVPSLGLISGKPLRTYSVALSSILWSFWDPTWLQVQRDHQKRGFGARGLRVQGKAAWRQAQGILFVSRAILVLLLVPPPFLGDLIPFPGESLVAGLSAALALFQSVALYTSLTSLKLQGPVRVRLVSRKVTKDAGGRLGEGTERDSENNKGSPKSTSTLSRVEASGGSDPFASLSLSTNPPSRSPRPARAPARVHPTFGVTSELAGPGGGGGGGGGGGTTEANVTFGLASQSFSPLDALLSHASSPAAADPPSPSGERRWQREGIREEDVMEWEALPPTGSRQTKDGGGSSSWGRNVELAPQRFFPPEQPTGLESLFEGSLSLGDRSLQTSSSAAGAGGGRTAVGCTGVYAALRTAAMSFWVVAVLTASSSAAVEKDTVAGLTLCACLLSLLTLLVSALSSSSSSSSAASSNAPPLLRSAFAALLVCRGGLSTRRSTFLNRLLPSDHVGEWAARAGRAPRWNDGLEVAADVFCLAGFAAVT